MNYIYFIECDGYIKIGYTSNLPKRLQSFDTLCPPSYRLVGLLQASGKEEETRIHREWAQYRVKGEWFRAAPKLKHWIDRYADEQYDDFVSWVEDKEEPRMATYATRWHSKLRSRVSP